jgi:glucokinase
MRILAGDIGGTKTILAVVDIDASEARLVIERRYDSRAYPGLGPILEAFFAETGVRAERACFGVAGPVLEDRCEATNLPWVVDAGELAAAYSLGPTHLVNDFEAVAYGVLRMGESDLVALNPGTPVARAPIAVLGAGTGLGEAFLVWTGDGYRVVPSEGGHVDFAPRDELQIGLLRWLMARHARVSYERVLSGIGLPSIYAFLREAGVAPESQAVREALERGEDLGAVVGSHAVAGTDALASATIDLFVSVYGAEAGNLALKVVARGGVYVAGGIAPKILPRMTDGRFRAAYIDKGRLSPLVESIPCYAITNARVGLLGAAVAGLR